MKFSFEAIGRVHSCYTQKFGVPRQAGLSPSSVARIEIFPPFDRAEAFEQLEQSSHIWVQFVFHKNRRQPWKPKIKVPRLGGNKTAGVFATRSPIRPNPIGLSALELIDIKRDNTQLFLVVRSADVLDGTPVLDIKPYIPYCDHIPQARNTFAAKAPPLMTVIFSHDLNVAFNTPALAELKPLIVETLQLNPAPAYHNKTKRRYTTRLMHYDIDWCMEDAADGEHCIHVLSVRSIR